MSHLISAYRLLFPDRPTRSPWHERIEQLLLSFGVLLVEKLLGLCIQEPSVLRCAHRLVFRFCSLRCLTLCQEEEEALEAPEVYSPIWEVPSSDEQTDHQTDDADPVYFGLCDCDFEDSSFWG